MEAHPLMEVHQYDTLTWQCLQNMRQANLCGTVTTLTVHLSLKLVVCGLYEQTESYPSLCP